MNTPTIILALIIAAVLAASPTTAFGRRAATRRGRARSRSKPSFVFERRLEPRSKPSFVVEQKASVVDDDLLNVVHDETASPSTESSKHERTVHAVERAAFVAGVSAAAIGGVWHAVDMIGL